MVAAPPARHRSQADRRCFEEKIDRILGEHFAGFEGSTVETHTVDGATLRLAVARIVWPDEACGGKRVSSTQIAALRMAYATGDVAECLLLDAHGVEDAPSKRVVDACQSRPSYTKSLLMTGWHGAHNTTPIYSNTG